MIKVENTVIPRKIGSVSSYIKAIFDLRNTKVSEYSLSSYWFFRGQKNSLWGMCPNVFRNDALKYEFDAPKTALGNELLEMLRRNDISASSFAFTVANGGDAWEKRDGKYYRTIKKIDRLFDVSPVYNPAYSETTVACRSFDNILKIESDNLTQYWNKLDAEIDLIE